MNVMKEYEALRDAFRLVGVDLKLFEDGVEELGYEYSASGYLPDVVKGKRKFSHLMIVLSFSDDHIYFDIHQMIHESHPHVDDTIMCLDENSEELSNLLRNKKYLDFATTLISVIGEFSSGGQYRTPSDIMQCERCGEWNKDSSSFRSCRCGATLGCSGCLNYIYCDMCHRNFEPRCEKCQDDKVTPALVGDTEMMICDRCQSRLIANTHTYCPECRYLRRIETTCSVCKAAVLECEASVVDMHIECYRSKT